MPRQAARLPYEGRETSERGRISRCEVTIRKDVLQDQRRTHMRARELYDKLFTEYPGHVGFAPAVVTLALCLAVCATVVYGAVTLGKAVFLADTPAAVTGKT
jgi:hypothetical protein